MTFFHTYFNFQPLNPINKPMECDGQVAAIGSEGGWPGTPNLTQHLAFTLHGKEGMTNSLNKMRFLRVLEPGALFHN